MHLGTPGLLVYESNVFVSMRNLLLPIVSILLFVFGREKEIVF
jgi:hypothetical protein